MFLGDTVVAEHLLEGRCCELARCGQTQRPQPLDRLQSLFSGYRDSR
jgi:hypothetical protein